MTDDKKWQNKPEEGDNAARRDNRKYNPESTNRRKPGEGYNPNSSYERPRSRFNSQGGWRNPESDSHRFRNTNQTDRPRYAGNQEEKDGNRFEGSDRYRSSERYTQDTYRRTGNNRYGERPYRSYGDSDKFRSETGDNNNRPNRPYRPSGDYGNRFNPADRDGAHREGDPDRFNRFHRDDQDFRPRRRENAFGEEHPRRSSQEGRPYGERRTERFARPSFGGQSGTSERPVTTRPDGRPRRPRIKRSETHPSLGSERKTVSYNPTFDPDTPIRLNKFLANAGICSRREADEFIQAGVVKVNGEVVTELGVKVKPTDSIMFHNQPVSLERKVYILLNKPKDCVTTSDDPQERRTVMDLVKGACPERIYPVGRLDRNTTGVLLLTNAGELASKLTHPKFKKRKIYQVTLNKELSEEDFRTIQDGIQLDDEVVKVDNLSYVDEDQLNVVGIEIHTGQNRVVRRIFESLGYKVFKLDRVYFAGLTKKNLPRGKWRHLTQQEVNLLKMGAFA